MKNGIYGLLQDSARRYPDRPFITDREETWNYRRVEGLAAAVSEKLRALGVARGDRVILYCGNSIQYVAGFFGVLGAGAVAVPVNPNKMRESFLYIVNKSRPRLILACGAARESLGKIDPALLPETVDIDRLDIWDTPRGDVGSGHDAGADADDVALILFTSGTTADPKGVVLTHGNLLANTGAIIEYLKLTREDSILMTLPFTYSYGNSVLLTHAFAGASVILDNNAAFPGKVLEGIKKHRVTGFSTVGSYANLLLKCVRNSGGSADCFDALRYMTFAGEATSTEDLRYFKEHFPHVKVYVMYGQTEAAARLSYLCPEQLERRPGSVGKGLSNIELRVIGDAGYDVRPGEVGEIIARGPSIMKGYWEDAAETARVLKNGWLYTGDAATVDEDGYIYIKGRKSDIIKYMGHRISPAEIERALNSCSCIKESAAVESVLDRLPVIKAYIVPETECRIDEVRKTACATLPAYMRPHIYEVVGQLPKTESGKIKRSALRSM